MRAVSNKSRLRLPATVVTGVPFNVGPAQLVLEQPSVGRLPDKIEVSLRPIRTAANAVRGGLTVSRPNRDAQIIQVRYQSGDSMLAAAVPNMLLDEFIRFKSETNKTEASSTAAFLRQQVASYDTQLRRAESALGAFREREKVVSIGDEAESQVQRMAALQAERDQLQAERDALSSILAKDNRDGSSRARDIAAFPSFIANRAMQDILQSLIELENSRSQLLIRRNPENADVVALTQRIDGLQGQLTQMAKAYLEGVDSKIASLNTTFRSFGQQVEAIPAKEIEFARLSRQQKLLADLSTLLQTRLKEAEIREAVDVGDVRIIDRALVPDFPSSPRLFTNVLVGLLAGVFLGFAAAIARTMLDTCVRTNEDVQSVTGRLPVLGAIPRIHAASASNGLSPRLITAGNSRDAFAEAYRALRTNITFAAAEGFHQAVVITSAAASDGKSTTAANSQSRSRSRECARC